MEHVVTLIRKEDSRFERQAYFFVRTGLDFAVQEVTKKDPARAKISRHLNGREVAEGLRTYALQQFGPLTKTVLNAWGIQETIHFGDIVYNLIEYSILSKTNSDCREDFAEVFDFEAAFVAPFLPRARRVPLPIFAETD